MLCMPILFFKSANLFNENIFFVSFSPHKRLIYMIMVSSLTRVASKSDSSAGLVMNESAISSPTDDKCPFTQIVARYRKSITQLAYRLLGWRDEELEDIVQEVFLAAWKNRKKFRGQSNIQTWLTRITINKCHSYRRKRLLKMKLLKLAQTRPISETPLKSRITTLKRSTLANSLFAWNLETSISFPYWTRFTGTTVLLNP